MHRSDLLSESKQNENAGNGGDLLKHSAYLALIHELTSHPTWRDELNIVEAHSGKGVYAARSPNLRDARGLPGYRESPLGVAQETTFKEPPTGLGSIVDLLEDEVQYAASAVLHAFELSRLSRRTLTLMDHDTRVRNTVILVFREPALEALGLDLRLVDPGTHSEPAILHAIERNDFSKRHILHFDPFAFVMDRDASTRNAYKSLMAQCDNRVGRKQLAAATLFFTWGSNNRAALDDLDGVGYLGGLSGGYRELINQVHPSRRIVLTWCWGLYFSLLLIVPSDLRAELVARLCLYVKPFRPRLNNRFTLE